MTSVSNDSSILDVGDVVPSNLEVSSVDYEVIPLQMLIKGSEAVTIIFLPHAYEYDSNEVSTMEKLLIEVNILLPDFESRGIRVICVVK